VEYRLLGSVEVRRNGQPINIGGDKQRALLAVLLLHRGEVVSTDGLIDALWGERPPPSALNSLHVHVSRLRRALEGEPGGEANGVLVTRAPGYVLNVAPRELDLDRFRDLADEGRHALAGGDAPAAARLLREAMSLWRGPALAEFAFDPFALAAIARLDELRLAVLEDRIDADLQLGAHRELVAELAALVEQNPLRERLRGQLMLALYRCGRQAEALDVYQEFRRALSAELGLDPGEPLRRLEQAILSRDATLDLQASGATHLEAPTGSPALPVTKRAVHPRRVKMALAGGTLIAIAVIGAVIATIGSGASSTMIAADSVGAISAAGGAVTADVPVGSSPSSVAAGQGAVWVANYSAGTVSRIDLAARAVVQTIPVDSTPSAVAVGAGYVWVANTFSGMVSRIDPKTNAVVQRIGVGNGPSGVSVGFGSVWVANSSDGTLSRIDATTGAPQRTIPLLNGATGVAAGLRAVWVSDEASGRVLRVDPRTDQVIDTISVGNGPTAIAVGFGSVWVTNSLDGTVSQIDPRTDSVAWLVRVGQGPNAIAVGPGAVWIANEFAGTVSRIDPAGNGARTIRVGSRPEGVAVAGGLVWVGAQASDTIHRGGTLMVLFSGSVGSLDPAQAYAPALIPLTNDGLTALKRVGGSDGAQVVPDLATSLPVPTNGGHAYTFQLRSGIRYSNGQPVRPEDFRRAIERDFRLGDAIAPNYYANLVGGATCVSHPAHCDLTRGIVPDDSAGTVTFNLVTPDPELLYRLAVWDAVAVPAGTPDHNVGHRPIPATGPYAVASVTPREVRLVRNPYFHEWSRAARPDGYPAQIVFKVGGSPDAELTAVERGTADYTLDGPPPDRLTEVRTRFASQLHTSPSDWLDMLVLNTRVAPFNDLNVRRALNYAVDRAKIANLIGSPVQPTCQFLTPYIPGYRRYCPYTIAPNGEGASRALDLATAKRLIAASHTRGTAITLWNFGTFSGDAIRVGRYLVTLLDQLGYRASERNLISAGPAAEERFADSRTRAQVALFPYFPNYPAASEYLRWFLSCRNFLPDSTANSNWAEFCDPRLDDEIRRALAAQEANSPAASKLWAEADRTVTNDAPLVPLVIPDIADFVSRRVGDYQYSPQLGGTVLIDQLWVK
jgi:YVTN family beta-propeller protein